MLILEGRKVALAHSHLSLGTSGFLGWSSVFRGLGKWGHFSAQARPSGTMQGQVWKGEGLWVALMWSPGL